MRLWLDASDPASLQVDGSGELIRWNDKSGSGNNVRPTLATNPIVDTTTDPSRPFVAMTDNIRLSFRNRRLFRRSESVTAFFVLLFIGGVGHVLPSSGSPVHLLWWPSLYESIGTDNRVQVASPFTGSAWIVYAIRGSAVNGLRFYANNGSTPFATATFGLGYTNRTYNVGPVQSRLGEIRIYAEEIDDAAFAATMMELKSKWNIA